MTLHPVWVCGLKPLLRWDVPGGWQVTPCMGVWIETSIISAGKPVTQGHTLYGCVDWNTHAFYWVVIALSHTLYGCVDWNEAWQTNQHKQTWSHPVWVCGLKLRKIINVTSRGTSHPVWVCGLKQKNIIMLRSLTKSHPVWVCGLKQFVNKNHYRYTRHTLYGCVDWNWGR